jgi:copper chaperone CopZ
VRRALEGLDSIARAAVDLESGEAIVEVNAKVPPAELVEAVEDKVILSWARGALARLSREGS